MKRLLACVLVAGCSHAAKPLPPDRPTEAKPVATDAAPPPGSRHSAHSDRREDEADAKQRHLDALALTKQAREAASAGDCAAVADLGAKVKALDPDVKATSFDQDPTIASCAAP